MSELKQLEDQLQALTATLISDIPTLDRAAVIQILALMIQQTELCEQEAYLSWHALREKDANMALNAYGRYHFIQGCLPVLYDVAQRLGTYKEVGNIVIAATDAAVEARQIPLAKAERLVSSADDTMTQAPPRMAD